MKLIRYLATIPVAMLALTVSATPASAAVAHNPLPPGPFVTARPTVVIDESSDPAYRGWLRRQAIPTLRQWYPVIGDALAAPAPGHPGYTPPTRVTILVDSTVAGYAGTAGTTIITTPALARDNPDDLGAIVHEETHVIQSYPTGMPGWIAEGIADWAREYIYGDRLPRQPLPGESYLQGYSQAAWFLDWIEDTYNDPWLIHDLNVRCHNGTYTDRFFVQRTGFTVDTLYAQMEAEL